MKYFIVSFISFFALLASAQDSMLTKSQFTEQALFEGSHFGISLIPIFTQKASTKWVSGPYQLGATPVRGVEAGVSYHFNFNKWYALVVGLHGCVSVRNYTFRIPKEDFTPQDSWDFEEDGRLSQTADFSLMIPVYLERRWFTRHNRHWNISAGINTRFAPDQYGEISGYEHRTASGQAYQAVQVRLEVGNDYKPWLDYHLGGGYNWVFKNNNLIRVNLEANLSKMELARGTYYIDVPGKLLSKGTYASCLNYIGLSVNYIFTGTRKRWWRYLEAQHKYR